MNDLRAIKNLTFDRNSSREDIHKATDKIVKAIAEAEKTTGKVSTDVQKGSEKITDAIGRIKIANSEQAIPPTPAVKTVCHGLKGVSQSTTQLANYFYSNPSEWQAVGEKASAANERLGKIADSVKSCAKGLQQLQSATTEASKMAGWIGSNVCGCEGGGRGGLNQTIPVENSFGSLWQKYGG